MKTDALVGIQDMGAAGLTCLDMRDGSARRRRRRDRRVARAAARDRHDAVRNHALRVAGAHAARRQAGARSRGRAHLREVGPARRAHRRGHDRRPAAREERRRRRRRHPEHVADRRGAAVPAADGGAGVPRGGAAAVAGVARRAGRRAPRCSAGCSRRRRSPASGGSTGSTTTWCAPTRSCVPGMGAGVVRVKGTARALALSVDCNAPVRLPRSVCRRAAGGGRGGAQRRVRRRRSRSAPPTA